MKCPHCQSGKRQNKAGKTRFGSQRFFCLSCRRTYTPMPKAQGHEASVRQQAVRYSLEGLSQRKVGRLLGVAPQSVANWIALASSRLEEMKLPVVPDEVALQAGEVVEQDEVYSFCLAKRNKKGATKSTRPCGST